MGRFTEDCQEDRSLLSGSWPEAYDSPELDSRPCYLHASSHTHQVSVCCGQPEDRGFRQPESSAAMRNNYHHQHDHVDIGGAISAPASTWWLPCFQPCLTLSCLLPVSQPGFYAHPVRVAQLWESPQQSFIFLFRGHGLARASSQEIRAKEPGAAWVRCRPRPGYVPPQPPHVLAEPLLST